MYLFREIKKEEVSIMFDMILQRMKWMNDVGIQQWNVTKYDEVYPLSYYEQARLRHEVFVLVNTDTKKIVSAGVLLKEDERWCSVTTSALYLHNFVTNINEKGVGTIFIQYVQEYAKQQGVQYFRLDSAVGNIPLEKYYSALGFVEVGTCVDGMYEGILREKKV